MTDEADIPEEISEEPEERSTPEVPPEDVAGLKSALAKERKARERAEGDLKQVKFLREHSHLTEDDLKGVKADRWEYLATRIPVNSESAEVTSGASTEVPEAERKEMERFASRAGGTGPPPETKYTPTQVREIGMRNQAEALRIIRSGLMEEPKK